MTQRTRLPWAARLAAAAWTLGIAGSPSLFAADDLQAALRNNDSETLEAVVREDGAVEFAAPDGKTVLMAAAADDNRALVAYLIEHRVDVGRRNHRGGTALMYAAANGSIDTARLLLDAGAEVDGRAENGWTALTLAAAKGHDAVVELLLTRGADPNVPDVFGFTALMRAAQNRRAVVVSRLLDDPRTDADRVNVNDMDALDVAVHAGHCDIARLLGDASGRDDRADCASQPASPTTD